MFDRPTPSLNELVEVFKNATEQVKNVDPSKNGNFVCRHMISDDFVKRGYSKDDADLIAVHIETQVPDEMFNFSDNDDDHKEAVTELVSTFCDTIEAVIELMRKEFPTAPVPAIVSGMQLQL